MEAKLQFNISSQPDDTTCGATCLHSIYRFYRDDSELTKVIDEVEHLEHGGTLGVMLGCHALRKGYRVKIYTYNLQMFDPSWFAPFHRASVIKKLLSQADAKNKRRLKVSTKGYIDFLKLGGQLALQDLTPSLIRKYLKKEIPVLTGLSSTYLYRTTREYGPDDDFDDIRGEPAGHFVVLSGYDFRKRTVLVADPYRENPISQTNYYEVSINRLVCSILLGVLTYDANLLVITPKNAGRKDR